MKKVIISQMFFALIISILGVYSHVNADTWPSWRGPDNMGIAAESNPPLKWSETENIKWKVKLTGDASNSSPVIWEDKIFFQTAVQTDKKQKLLLNLHRKAAEEDLAAEHQPMFINLMLSV